jgi:cyclopropane fatty-acyl-phospholipid synthase-like methyltransferase
MQPHHTLFEFGTGHGLASKFFIEYLEPAHFAGNDASAERLRIARMLFDRRNLSSKRPDLILNDDNSLDWLDGRKFDYVWSYAVFVHVPPEDVEEIMKNFRKAMHKDTICLFSYTGAPGVDMVEQLNVKDWHHGFPFFQKIAAKYGCEVTEETAVLNRIGRHSPPNRLIKMTLKSVVVRPPHLAELTSGH